MACAINLTEEELGLPACAKTELLRTPARAHLVHSESGRDGRLVLLQAILHAVHRDLNYLRGEVAPRSGAIQDLRRNP